MSPLPGRFHWHVILTHFPISLFMTSAAFMALHLLTASACYEWSAFLCLAAGTAALVPGVASGWLTWKVRYRGARTGVFLKKLRLAGAVVPLGVGLVLWRTFLKTTIHTTWHYVYSLGVVLLFVGVVLEGVYGGPLNHRERKAP